MDNKTKQSIKLNTIAEVLMELINENLISNKTETSQKDKLQLKLDRLCKTFPGSHIAINRYLLDHGYEKDDPVAYMERLIDLISQGESPFTDYSQKRD